MAYSAAALARRRCTHVYPEGHPRAGYQCRAFARWDSPGALDGSGLCTAHAGRTRGPDRRGLRLPFYECRTAPKCRCVAYPFPHRPGGGLCRWPDPPKQSLQPFSRYFRFRYPARSARGYFAPTVRHTPDVTPANTPPAYAVAPTVSGGRTPAAATDAALVQVLERLARK